jgi:hypothetical protein
MTDGNKESTKELLSTFRSLFAIDISGLFLIVTLYTRSLIDFHLLAAGLIGIILAVVSAVAMIYLFFLVIPRLHNEDESIIYDWPVIIVSNVGFWTFILAYSIIVVSIALK